MLSIVVPAYDEEARLGGTLARLVEFFGARSETWEVIVADDGSCDRTAAITLEWAERDARVRLVRLPKNRGKGAAVRAGVRASVGDLVLFSDADLATPIEELDKLRARIDDGYDVAIGSRALGDSDIVVRQHPARELMGRTFNLVVRALFLGGIRDTQCGFKLFRGDVAREIFAAAQIDGFAFDVEILRLARERHRIAEVPVVWRHVEQSKVSPGIDAARMLRDVLILRLRGPRRKPRRDNT